MSDIMLQISEEYPDLYFIPGQRDGKYPYSHSLLVKDTLIDTGISSGFIRKLKRKVDINTVLLSHWHEDHISGNRILPDANYRAHPEDIPIIENVSKMYKFYCITPESPQKELFDTILQGLRLEDTPVDYSLSGEEILKIGDSYELQVIYTPGHTNGHCCFYEINSKIAFLADIDLSNLGPWYGCLDSDLIKFEESIEKVMALNIEIAISGHKGIFKGKKEIQNALQEFQSKIYERDDRVLESLSERRPKSSDDLSNLKIVYPRYSNYKIYEILAEKIMIESHLDKLLKENKIIKKDNGYVLS